MIPAKSLLKWERLLVDGLDELRLLQDRIRGSKNRSIAVARLIELKAQADRMIEAMIEGQKEGADHD